MGSKFFGSFKDDFDMIIMGEGDLYGFCGDVVDDLVCCGIVFFCWCGVVVFEIGVDLGLFLNEICLGRELFWIVILLCVGFVEILMEKVGNFLFLVRFFLVFLGVMFMLCLISVCFFFVVLFFVFKKLLFFIIVLEVGILMGI